VRLPESDCKEERWRRVGVAVLSPVGQPLERRDRSIQQALVLDVGLVGGVEDQKRGFWCWWLENVVGPRVVLVKRDPLLIQRALHGDAIDLVVVVAPPRAVEELLLPGGRHADWEGGRALHVAQRSQTACRAGVSCTLLAASPLH